MTSSQPTPYQREKIKPRAALPPSLILCATATLAEEAELSYTSTTNHAIFKDEINIHVTRKAIHFD